MRQWFPDLADLVSLSIVEAGPNLLAGFDETCWRYYTKHLREHNVDVRTGCAITSVDPADDGRVSSATMANGSSIRFGCMVWSAGLAPIKFVEGPRRSGKAWRFHAIDATLSQWPRRLDGVAAHKGPPQYFSLVDFHTGRRTRSTRTATRTGRRRRLRGPAPGRTSERSAYEGCGGLV